jgi:hypothetical protein
LKYTPHMCYGYHELWILILKSLSLHFFFMDIDITLIWTNNENLMSVIVISGELFFLINPALVIHVTIIDFLYEIDCVTENSIST